jgi:hypothetical protein
MKTSLLSLLFGISILISCNKEDQECIEVQYDQLFKIEAGESYCFEDGNFIAIEALENGFCPCFAYCIWEGEMLMTYEGEFDGNQISGVLGSSPKTNNTLFENKYSVFFGEIVEKNDCTGSDPSPEIMHAYIEINR